MFHGPMSVLMLNQQVLGSVELTMWYCPDSQPAAAAIDLYLLPARPAGTDRQTSYHFIDPAPHTMWAVTTMQKAHSNDFRKRKKLSLLMHTFHLNLNLIKTILGYDHLHSLSIHMYNWLLTLQIRQNYSSSTNATIIALSFSNIVLPQKQAIVRCR